MSEQRATSGRANAPGSRGGGRGVTPAMVALLVLLLVLSLATGLGAASIAPVAPNASWAPHLASAGAARPDGATLLVQAHAALGSAGAPTALRAASAPAPFGPARPPGPTAVSLVWDAADGYVLAVAPNITGNYTSTISNLSKPSQTWKFLGGTWTELHPSSAPSSRGFAAMTYDAKDGYVLLFGGVPAYGFCAPYPVVNQPGQPFYNCYNDTWKFVGGSWTNLTGQVHGSPPRYFDGTTGYQTGPQLVYDSLDGYAVLYGENNIQTWGYQGDRWLNLTASSMDAPGVSGSMAYDAADGYVLYFGGEPMDWNGSTFACTDQAWEFAHGLWVDVSNLLAIQPSPRDFASMSYDASTGQVTLFGGVCQTSGTFQNYFETWTYSGGPYGQLGQWNELSGSGGPTPRFDPQLLFDPTDNETVLFGGASASTATNSISAHRDTWVLRGGNWSSAGPLIASNRVSLDRGTALSLSVVDLPFDAFSAGQFVYSGLPPGCIGLNAPALNCTPQTVGDFLVTLNVTSGLGGASASLVVTVNPQPTLQTISLSRMWSEPGVPVIITTLVNGGTGPFSFNYTGLPGCTSADLGTFACTPAAVGTFQIHATATDALGLRSQLTQTLNVVPDLAFGQIRLSPATTDVGVGTVALVNLTGGLGPFLLAYHALPPGCPSANTTSLVCRPAVAGNYSLSVTASDSAGFSVTGVSPLSVNPDPTVLTFTVSDPTPSVGETVHFQLDLAGGTGPFTVSYGGLPAGCAGANSTRLDCTPSVAGTFAIVVRATDSVGYTIAEPVTLIVGGPAQAPHGGSSPGWLGSLGLSPFGQGVLVGLFILVVVGFVAGWSTAVNAREADAARLADELLDRAPDLASEVDEPDVSADESGRMDGT